MTTVDTASGKLKGTKADGISVFKGIPFAAPPVGPNRWLPPQPAAPWAGVRNADTFGNSAMQNPSILDNLLGGGCGPVDEDCLYLNVWTPAADGAKRPVLVWIHGGAFTIGSGMQDVYHGDRLAKRGDVVVVTVNYRLGPLGFLNLNEITNGAIPASGNEGLLDQIAALEWVRENIAGFGGDPANVTIFGESAGAMSVGSLLAMPQARGLFQKAIPQSGAAHIGLSTAQAVKVAEGVLAATELKATDTDGLRNADAKMFTRAQAALALNKVPGYGTAELGGMPFQPRIDGKVLAQQPFETICKGAAKDIALMTGTTLEEWKLFGAMEPTIAKLDEDGLLKRLGTQLPAATLTDLIGAYREALPARGQEATPPNLFMAIQTDRIFTAPAARLLDAHTANGGSAYTYRFDWTSPLMDGAFGACHALELGFVFGTFDLEGAVGFCGGGEDAKRLSDSMMDAWINFARHGKPGGSEWAQFTPDNRPTMIFAAQNRMEETPNQAEHAAWASIPDSAIGSV